MLLGNTNIENTAWKAGFDLIQTSAGWHRRSDRHNLWITFGSGNQAIGKNRCIAWQIAARFLLCTSNNVKFRHRMIFFRRWASKRMAMTFLRYHMHQHWPMRAGIAKIFQNRQQMPHIMPINRPDMGKAQLAKYRISAHQIARCILGPPRRSFDFSREMACHFAHQITDRMIGLRSNET